MNKTAIDVIRVTTAVIYLPYESNLDCLAREKKARVKSDADAAIQTSFYSFPPFLSIWTHTQTLLLLMLVDVCARARARFLVQIGGMEMCACQEKKKEKLERKHLVILSSLSLSFPFLFLLVPSRRWLLPASC